MERFRSRPLIPIAILAFLTANARVSGCGGWWEEEPPHSLAGDLDRLPAKTLGQILLETEERTAEFAPLPVTREEVLEVVAMIGTKNPNLVAARIDRFVMRARANYVVDSQLLNALYDVRDAITSKGPTDEERKKYAEWRMANRPTVEENVKAVEFAKNDPMRPHTLYLQGAARFATDDRQHCRAWFEEIVKEFPDHPRGETARFLLARCDLWSARYTGEFLREEEQGKRLAIAEAAFRDYLKLYPKGRYAADAHGWLGGILWETRPAESLEHYITQFEDKSHPECAKSAAHMIEKQLARVSANPEGENEAMLKIVAKYPRIAQAAVYFVLNAPEIDPYDGKYDEPANLKQWRIKVLPKLAAAVAREEALYQGAWALRLRAMLAQAASAAGQQDEALKLTAGSAAELTRSDDLLFSRMVALQRAGRSRETVEAGLLFLKTFNDSPLREAVPVRIAHALVDEHRAGEAYLNLCQIEIGNSDRWNGRNDTIYPPAESALDLAQSSVYPDIKGTDAAADLKETILNLAPLAELEAVVERQEWNQKPELLAELKLMLVRRKASNEDFAGASRYVEDLQLQERITAFGSMAEAAGRGEPLEKAQAMIALGDAFEHAWKQLGTEDSDRFYQGATSLVLRENARGLGFSDPDPELENRNLLRHATRWWLNAARTAPGTDLSASARLRALEGIRLTALSSNYDFTRAVESNTDRVSKGIHDDLTKESPDSREARDAMYWSFIPCPKPRAKEGEEEHFDEWRVRWDIRGENDLSREGGNASRLGGYRALHYAAFGEFQFLKQRDEPANAITQPMLAELNEVTADPGDLLKKFPADKVTRDLEMARGAAENAAQFAIVNLLEDLNLFYQVPGLTDEARGEYLRLRLRCGGFPRFNHWEGNPDARPALHELFRQARENPALAAVRDFIDYAELYASEADRGSSGEFQPVYSSYEDVEKECRAFLDRYPKSPRREACSLLLMRSIYRQLPKRFDYAVNAENLEAGTTIVESRLPFHKELLENAIAAYEKEYPQMRYAAEVRNYRGIIAWRTAEYGPALDLTIAQLDDLSHPDLRREAAFRLAAIFADLGDPRHRKAVIVAVKARPTALAKLKPYLAIAPQKKDHPLRCLGTFLEDEFGLGPL
ncbi:MAG: hypothetical protein V4819_08325 [Verrucomicrobiota bacterium]